ncbi:MULTISPECIES: hypothetical protein [unclassified Paenibacillus]|uniref:hypothetical protein n=1 Tax=unclassified Paenibacillus TaxID=185978 RepID=UPI00110F7E6A|nr:MULTISPECIES: hypothetical protein [unclassified Paenibacillus]
MQIIGWLVYFAGTDHDPEAMKALMSIPVTEIINPTLKTDLLKVFNDGCSDAAHTHGNYISLAYH